MNEWMNELINLNKAYSKYLFDFSSPYEDAFPNAEIKIKLKALLIPWLLKE